MAWYSHHCESSSGSCFCWIPLAGLAGSPCKMDHNGPQEWPFGLQNVGYKNYSMFRYSRSTSKSTEKLYSYSFPESFSKSSTVAFRFFGSGHPEKMLTFAVAHFFLRWHLAPMGCWREALDPSDQALSKPTRSLLDDDRGPVENDGRIVSRFPAEHDLQKLAGFFQINSTLW